MIQLTELSITEIFREWHDIARYYYEGDRDMEFLAYLNLPGEVGIGVNTHFKKLGVKKRFAAVKLPPQPAGYIAGVPMFPDSGLD